MQDNLTGDGYDDPKVFKLSGIDSNARGATMYAQIVSSKAILKAEVEKPAEE